VCDKINKRINEINNLFDSFDTNKFMLKSKQRKVRFVDNNSIEREIQDVNDHIADDMLFEAMEEEGRFESPQTNSLISDQALFEIWENIDNFQNMSNNKESITINCFKSKLFSSELAQIAIMESHDAPAENFWKHASKPLWEPGVYINGEMVETLVDSGASCSVMS